MKTDSIIRTLDNEEIVQQCSYYYDLAYEIFEFLKPMICIPPIDPILYISPDDCYLYGEYSEGWVQLYLITILKTQPTPVIECCILEVLMHELFHSTQVIDYNVYAVNRVYRNQLEDEVKQQENRFIIDNQNLIKATFTNMWLTPSYLQDVFITKSLLIYPLYKRISIEGYWAKLISRLEVDNVNGVYLDICDALCSAHSVKICFIGTDEGSLPITQFIKLRGAHVPPTNDVLNFIYNMMPHIYFEGGLESNSYDNDKYYIIVFRYRITEMDMALIKYSEEDNINEK